MALAGDFEALRDLRARTEPSQMQRLTTLAANRMRGTALKLVADEFRGSFDPYGKPWLDLSSRKGKPLIDTGRMRSAVVVTASGPTVQITIGTTYAAYHQRGTKPHARAAGVVRKNARGRFAKKSAKSAYLSRHGAYQHGGIPKRQMLPEDSTGGLGFTWYRAFSIDVQSVVVKALRGAA